MENGENRYFNENGQTAMGYMAIFDPEAALDSISKERFTNYVTGMRAIYQHVLHEDPDLILAPMRGAGPLIWALEAIAERSGQDLPPIVDLPIGTNTNIDNSKEMKGLTKPEKNSVIEDYIETIYEVHNQEVYNQNDCKPLKILLIDEAKSGGAISQAARHISKVLVEYKQILEWDVQLSIIAANDTDYRGSSHLGGIMGNRFGSSHKTTLAMPQIDKTWLLPMILRQDPSTRAGEVVREPYETQHLLEVVQNEKAKKVYKERVNQVLDESLSSQDETYI